MNQKRENLLKTMLKGKKMKLGVMSTLVAVSSLFTVGGIDKPVEAKSKYVKKVVDVEVTAYTFGYGANRTASGKKLKVGYVAAPREYKFGSIVDIPSIEKRLKVSKLPVYDRGGAIKRLSGNKIRIDVAFPSYSEAIKFGRKTYHNVSIYVPR